MHPLDRLSEELGEVFTWVTQVLLRTDSGSAWPRGDPLSFLLTKPLALGFKANPMLISPKGMKN